MKKEDPRACVILSMLAMCKAAISLHSNSADSKDPLLEESDVIPLVDAIPSQKDTGGFVHRRSYSVKPMKICHPIRSDPT